MNNSTYLQTSLVISGSGPSIFLMILFSITLCLHLPIQWCIYKARLHTNNNYYLIRALSLADSLANIWIIFFAVMKRFGIVNLQFRVLGIILSSFLHSSYSMSLVITMLIVTDRWIAMQFALRYHALVSKRKINIAILVSSFILLIIYLTLLFCLTPKDGHMVQRNEYSIVFSGTLILITCIYIIVFAKLTIRIRNQNEARIRDITNFHGAEAERLDTIKRLTRSVKDVWKLNIMTCVFLVPKILVSIFQVYLPNQLQDDFKIFVALANAIYLISNPIVYLFCFTQIRQYWYRTLFTRNSVNIDTD